MTSAEGVAVPFELVVKHIVVKVSINHSSPLPFILDTGDKLAIIDLDRAKELGLTLTQPVQGSGAGGATVTGSFLQDAWLAIPELQGFSQPVAIAFPLNGLAGPLGQRIDGIIGGDFIKQFITEIDYEARTIRLHDKDKFQYSGSGQSIPIQLNADGHPVLEAEVTPLGGKVLKGRFVLDLGSSASLALYSPFVMQHHLPGPNTKTIRAMGAAGVGGQMKAQIGRVSELKIGNFRLSNPMALFSEDKAGAFASAEIQGNLGEQILSRFKIFLDYSHQRIILEPNKKFGEPFAPAFAGIAVEAQGPAYKTLQIVDVLADSPGSEAGLQRGDVILAVDGRAASEISLSELVELFERPVSCNLEVKRDNRSFRITLRPRKLV